MPDAMIHPTPEQLTEFGLGKLPEHTAAAVAAHLESCPSCRQAVAAVPPDSFLDKVRAAGPVGSSFPPGLAKPGNALSGTVRPETPHVALTDISPELACHPRYRILRELGRGGMGVVYQARHKEMDRQVVIKVINRTLLDRPDALERFRREIRAAAQLSHPNIVTAYDAEQAGASHMLVMEFVPGQSLAEVVKKKGALPIDFACHFMRQVALGLQHAHERKMVHRDIKPQNLILTPKGQVKILDFGLAKMVREEATSTGLTSDNAYMGTPDYCAPEQAQDARTADIRADLYSLGCTLYCLLAGRPPFREDSVVKTILAHLEQAPQPLRELRPEVPAELWQVVKKLLAKEPAQRYQKPIEVAQALVPFIKSRAKEDAKGSSVLLQGMGSPGKGTVIETDTEIKKILREVPGKASPKEVPRREKESSRFADLTGAAPKDVGRAREEEKPLRAAWWKRPGVLAAAVVVSVALILMAVIIIMVSTREVVLVVEVNEPNPDVYVDGETVKVSWHNGGKRAEIRVKLGTRKVEVKKDGFTVYGEEVKIEDGKRCVITARLDHRAMPPPAGEPNQAKIPQAREKGVAKADQQKEEFPQKDPLNDLKLPGSPGADKDGFVQLFNGKDKKGWKTKPEWEGDWRVENGVLIWSGLVSSFLWTERDDYKDFHVRAKTRISDRQYAHLIVRDAFGQSDAEHAGYAIVINSTNPNSSKTGSLHVPGKGLTVKVLKSPVPPNEWFTLEVIAKGNRVVVKVNGQTMANSTGPEQSFARGRITLLAMNEISERQRRLEFNKIEVKELPTTTALTNSIGMKLALVKPGTFLMGSPPNEADQNGPERQHEVEITRPFYMGVYEVTQEQYERVMGYNPSGFSPTGRGKDMVKGMDTRQFPVESVTWEEAVEFCRRLSGQPEEKSEGRVYRLPTEAEWEYSCRGGHLMTNPSPQFHFGNSLSSAQANIDGNFPYGDAPKGPSLHRTTRVGSYEPNPLGLYDLHGNVWEWCADWYSIEYYKDGPRRDPQGAASGGPGGRRVTRGGSWYFSGMGECRAAYRGAGPPGRHFNIGFRVVLVVGARN